MCVHFKCLRQYCAFFFLALTAAFKVLIKYRLPTQPQPGVIKQICYL